MTYLERLKYTVKARQNSKGVPFSCLGFPLELGPELIYKVVTICIEQAKAGAPLKIQNSKKK